MTPWQASISNLAVPTPSPERSSSRETRTAELCPHCGQSLPNPNAKKQWEPEEDALLRQMYGRGDKIIAIAAQLGRPMSSIGSRVDTLGIPRRRPRG